MSVGQWLMTPYFWIPISVSTVLFGWLYFHEKRHYLRGTRCPTCYSTDRRTRFVVRYFLTQYIYNDALCEDDWHTN